MDPQLALEREEGAGRCLGIRPRGGGGGGRVREETCETGEFLAAVTDINRQEATGEV